jgi:hypothetical protein
MPKRVAMSAHQAPRVEVVQTSQTLERIQLVRFQWRGAVGPCESISQVSASLPGTQIPCVSRGSDQVDFIAGPGGGDNEPFPLGIHDAG